MHGQAPDPGSLAAPSGIVEALQHLGWVDGTALVVLGTFFVLGLFKGIVWQTSRIVILIAAYAAAARLGPAFGEVLLRWTHSGPNPPSEDQQQTAFYIACLLLFVGTLVALSLLSLLLQKLVHKAGLGFYDRLFGGLVGVGSGGIVVLFVLTVVYMFWPDSRLAHAAETSHSLQFSRRAVDLLGEVVPAELRKVFPAEAHPEAPGDGGSAHDLQQPGAVDAGGHPGVAAPTDASAAGAADKRDH